jgi:hypothetical protein
MSLNDVFNSVNCAYLCVIYLLPSERLVLGRTCKKNHEVVVSSHRFILLRELPFRKQFPYFRLTKFIANSVYKSCTFPSFRQVSSLVMPKNFAHVTLPPVAGDAENENISSNCTPRTNRSFFCGNCDYGGKPSGLSLLYFNDVVGWGVVSNIVIPPGTVILPYLGEYIGSAETMRRQQQYDAQVRLPSLHVPPW